MTITELIPVYLRYLQSLNRSAYTIKGVQSSLRDFVRYLAEEKIVDLEDLTTQVLENYRQDTAFRLTPKGTPLARSTRIQLICNVKGFTAFLKERDYLFQDSGEKLAVPRQAKRLPQVILDEKEIRRLMSACDMQSRRGYRNRIILEILYDTAIRRAEAAGIRLCDLDFDAGYIRIRGKFDKERVVPVSERVCTLIRNYLLFVRPSFVQGDDPGHLLLNRWGRRMEPNGIWAVVRRCVVLAGIRKKISTHSLRHTCATHMLKNGARVRHIQEMLGHASLNTTQIYTRVTINDLKRIHAKYHPGERMEGKNHDGG